MTMNRFLLVLLAFISSGPLCAGVGSLQEASQLFRQGQHSQALERVNGYLSSAPKDAQGRFLKGLILAEMNRTQDAIKTFNDLTDDYPELPEPYNNLAVLYAAQGQYEQAKNSLEMAIRTHPSYATAHENLGDIYAKMASQAYNKALQLDKSNTSAQMKLSLVKDIFTPAGLDRTKSGKSTSIKTAGTPSSVVTANSMLENQSNPPASGSVQTAKTGKTPPAKAARDPNAGNPTAQVEKTVQDWANAWSNRDVPGYLAFYSPNFKEPAGMNRTEWEAQRNQRLTRPEYIKVSISDLEVKVSGKNATATFKQRYESNLLKSNTRKTLMLEKLGEGWKIALEK